MDSQAAYEGENDISTWADRYLHSFKSCKGGPKISKFGHVT